MTKHPPVASVALGLVAPFLVLAAAPLATGQSPAASVHTDVQYQGTALTLPPNAAIAQLNPNDAISSVRILSVAYDVVLYEHPNFQGERIILGADEPDLRAFNATYHWNDRASSLRVVPRPIAEFWSGPGYTGTLYGVPLLPTTNNNSGPYPVRSVRIVTHGENAGCVLELYDQTSRQGNSVVILDSEPDLLARGFAGSMRSFTFDRPSGNWRDVPLMYPIRANPAVRASYGNQPVYRGPWLSNYVALHSLAELEAGTPFDWGGNRGGHNGTDIGAFNWRACNEDALEVVAAADGRVILSRDGIYDHMGGTEDSHELYAPCNPTMCDGSGNFVYLQHENGFVTQYAHLKTGGAQRFPVGTWVRKGTVLGIVASSGASSGPHLHFGVYAGSFNRDFRPRIFDPRRRTDLARTRISRWQGGSGGVPEDRAKQYGPFICPWFQEPGSGDDMWEGQVPGYGPQWNEPQDVFDVAVSAAPPWANNPVDDVTAVPVGDTVWALMMKDGGRGFLRLRTVAPSGAVRNFGNDVISFVADMPGDWRIEAQRLPPGATDWQTRAVRTFRAFPGTTQYTVPLGQLYTLENGTLRILNGIGAVGDQSNGTGWLAGIVAFPSARALGQVVAGRVRLRLGGVDGTNPFEKCAGCGGWGGRLIGDLVTLPSHQVVHANATQFELARVDTPADTLMEGSLTAAALDYIETHAMQDVVLRIRWEHRTNRNASSDMIGVHGTTGSDLTLWIKPPASVTPYGTRCAGASGSPGHGFLGGLPQIPNPAFRHTVGGLAPSVLGIYLLGLSPANIPLPTCTLYASPDLMVRVVTSSFIGSAEMPLPIPDDVALDGAHLFSQWLGLVAPDLRLLSASEGMETILRAY